MKYQMALLTTRILLAQAEIFEKDFEDLAPAQQILVICLSLFFLLILFAIKALILYLLFSFLRALPAEYRLMEPPMVFLLLIPCFNLVWNFFVYPQISRSYQNYFRDHGRHDVGSCGEGIGIAYGVCAVLVSIPCLNYITGIFCGPAMLVLLIIYLAQLHGLKKQVPYLRDAFAPR